MTNKHCTSTDKSFQLDFISGHERLYTINEAAKKLKLSRTTVWGFVRKGELGYVLKTGFERKVYHIPTSALRAYEHIREAKRLLKHAEDANKRLGKYLQRLRRNLREEVAKRNRVVKQKTK